MRKNVFKKHILMLSNLAIYDLWSQRRWVESKNSRGREALTDTSLNT